MNYTAVQPVKGYRERWRPSCTTVHGGVQACSGIQACTGVQACSRRGTGLYREGYRDTSLDKGTGPVQGGVQRVQPCMEGGRGWGCTGLHRGTGLYRGAGLYKEGYMGTSLDRGTGLYREGYMGTSLDRGTGLYWDGGGGGGGGGGVQACTGVGGTGLYRGAGLYKGNGVYREG